MRLYVYLIMLAIISSTTSCDTKKTPTKKESMASPADIEFPLEIQKGGEYESLQEIRLQAQAIIDSRIQQDPEPLSMITYGYFSPEFVFNKGKMSKEGQYLGHWMNFKEDFTYEYGFYGQTVGSGKYHFRFDDGALMMLNNDSDFEPKSWKLNSNSEAIALVGQHTFEVNNGMQIKMMPLDVQPTK